MQREMLISNSIGTTPSPGAMHWVGRVLADEAKRPKPGSLDGPAYFSILTDRDYSDSDQIRIVTLWKN